MGDTTRSDCPVAIFCGGDHVRLGRLAGAQAKALLVAHDTPLLWRLIDQLRAAGFQRVVAATTPRLERPISDALAAYRRDAPGLDLRVAAIREQERGLLFGLRSLLAEWSSPRFGMCLADIYFRANPFPTLDPSALRDGVLLGAASPAVPAERSLGGILDVEGDRVRRVIERPTSSSPPAALRWSGVAFAPRAATLAALEEFLVGLTDAPAPGDFFEHLRARGTVVGAAVGPDFVNVNSPDQLLLASLYARLERDPSREPLGEILAEAARALRDDIARRSAERPR